MPRSPHARLALTSRHRGDSFGYLPFPACIRGNLNAMDVKEVIRERIRQKTGGLDLDADVNAVVAANIGESGQTTSVSSTSRASAGGRREQESERRSK